MNRQMSWGIAALIVILIAAGGFMYWQWSSVQQLKEQLAQDEKLLEENEKVQHVVSKADEKPPDEPGFEWVRHGDHWDKIPVAEADSDGDGWLDPPPSGHWSDMYLPPMAELEVMYADDKDATFILERTKTLLKYGKSSHHPDALKAFTELSNFLNQLTSKLGTDVPLDRYEELIKLQWPLLDDPPKGWEGDKYVIKGENDDE